MTARFAKGMMAAVTITWLSAATARPALAASDVKPNIVVIVGDDMGYADIGVHGGRDCPTPNIDSLATHGVRCVNGYVSCPYCSPTRAGLLTGRYQTRFGHEFNPTISEHPEHGLSLNEKTLADRLKSAGYATGMVGKWHLGGTPELHPLRRGFDEFYGFLGGSFTYFPDGQLRGGDQVLRGTEPAAKEEYLTDAFSREAVAFVDRHKAEPFFLYYTFNAVHTPMEATDKDLARFANIADERRRTYCAMMSAMDDAIGNLLAKFRAENLEENTLIFFISDNGGPTWSNASNNTPLRGNKATTWEGGIHVPFLVQWKAKLAQGIVAHDPVISIDIVPTALAAAGVEVTSADKIDGANLLPYLTGRTKGGPQRALYWRFGPQFAIRAGDWKLVRAGDDRTGRADNADPNAPIMLFDLANDLGEQHDLAQQKPDKVAELQRLWNTWNEQNIEPSWPARKTPARQRGKAAKGKVGKKVKPAA